MPDVPTVTLTIRTTTEGGVRTVTVRAYLPGLAEPAGEFSGGRKAEVMRAVRCYVHSRGWRMPTRDARR